ncbi:MAG: RNA polymerase sigma factor [Prevotella sp.]|jgi:RNA polymerase sigma factor (sigma-70 family)
MEQPTNVYENYQQRLMAYGLTFTSDTELVKDCLQDVFLKFLQRCNVIPIASIPSFLFSSLRNRIIDEFRRASYRNDTSLDYAMNIYDYSDAEQSMIAKETEHREDKRVNALLECLTPHQRKALELYYIEEKDYDTVCNEMKMTYPSVRNLVYRGMQRMRAAAV